MTVVVVGVGAAGPGVAVLTIVAAGVTATTGPSVGGDDRAEVSAAPAEPTADASAPTADHARLPSSRMPTMPTIVAIRRVGEPSSCGGAGRATASR